MMFKYTFGVTSKNLSVDLRSKQNYDQINKFEGT